MSAASDRVINTVKEAVDPKNLTPNNVGRAVGTVEATVALGIAGDIAATVRVGNLTTDVFTAANSSNASGLRPATVGGAELNGQTIIATSGTPPTNVAPQLQEAAQSLGGVGARTNAGTVGACCEVRAANELLLNNPKATPKDINLTPAVRPRTGEVIPMCDNCKIIFGKK